MFRLAATDGTAAHWATDDLAMDDLTRLPLAEASWRVEEYHRAIKQATHVARCQCRVCRAQQYQIGLNLRALVVRERQCFPTGVNWLSAKWDIAHAALRALLADPVYRTTPAENLMTQVFFKRKLGAATTDWFAWFQADSIGHASDNRRFVKTAVMTS